MGWGTRGEGRGGSWGESVWEAPSASTAPSCPVNQSLRSEQGSGHRAQTGRGVSFLLDTGFGLAIGLAQGTGQKWACSTKRRP